LSDDIFARLYPHLSDAELDDARENIKQYLLLVVQVHERIQHDPARLDFSTLTNKKTNSTLPAERSNDNKRTLKT